jgi:hypothetical protein
MVRMPIWGAIEPGHPNANRRGRSPPILLCFVTEKEIALLTNQRKNQGMNSRRSRNGRSNNGGKRSYGGSGHNRSYESNGPEVKVRGTANQIFDKYVALARDANTAGDRIAAEGYFQHAEHYYRVYTGAMEANQARQAQQNAHSPDNGGGNGSNHGAVGADSGDDGDHSEPVTATVVKTDSNELREAELSETDVAVSEPN